MSTKISENNGLLASPWKSMLVAMVLVVAIAIATILFESILKTASFLDKIDIEHISMFLSNAAILAVTLLMYRKMRSASAVSLKSNSYWVISGALAGIGFAFVFLVLIKFIDGNNQESYINELIRFSNDIKSFHIYTLIMMMITMHVLIPVLEETLFRGMIFRSVAHRYGTYIGVISSAALFALIHIDSSIHFAYIITLLFGVLSAIFVHFSGKLTASYSMHITYNAFITMYSFIYGSALSAELSG